MSTYAVRLCFLGILLFLVSSCGPKSVQEIQAELAEAHSGKRRLSDLRPTAPPFQVHELTISRAKFQKSFAAAEPGVHGRTGFDIARIVQMFERSSAASPFPVYRLFHVLPNSPFAQLGLRNGDVIVGADDCVIASGIAFKKYISLLQWEKKAEIEVRRAGSPVLIKAKFVD